MNAHDAMISLLADRDLPTLQRLLAGNKLGTVLKQEYQTAPERAESLDGVDALDSQEAAELVDVEVEAKELAAEKWGAMSQQERQQLLQTYHQATGADPQDLEETLELYVQR